MRVAERLPEPRVDVAEPEAVSVALPREHCPDRLRVTTDAVVLDGDLGLGAVVGGRDGHVPDAVPAFQTVTNGVLHQRLNCEEGHGDR
jgi:hypothetical protein